MSTFEQVTLLHQDRVRCTELGSLQGEIELEARRVQGRSANQGESNVGEALLLQTIDEVARDARAIEASHDVDERLAQLGRRERHRALRGVRQLAEQHRLEQAHRLEDELEARVVRVRQGHAVLPHGRDARAAEGHAGERVLAAVECQVAQLRVGREEQRVAGPGTAVEVGSRQAVVGARAGDHAQLLIDDEDRVRGHDGAKDAAAVVGMASREARRGPAHVGHHLVRSELQAHRGIDGVRVGEVALGGVDRAHERLGGGVVQQRRTTVGHRRREDAMEHLAQRVGRRLVLGALAVERRAHGLDRLAGLGEHQHLARALVGCGVRRARTTATVVVVVVVAIEEEAVAATTNGAVVADERVAIVGAADREDVLVGDLGLAIEGEEAIVAAAVHDLERQQRVAANVGERNVGERLDLGGRVRHEMALLQRVAQRRVHALGRRGRARQLAVGRGRERQRGAQREQRVDQVEDDVPRDAVDRRNGAVARRRGRVVVREGQQVGARVHRELRDAQARRRRTAVLGNHHHAIDGLELGHEADLQQARRLAVEIPRRDRAVDRHRDDHRPARMQLHGSQRRDTGDHTAAQQRERLVLDAIRDDGAGLGADAQRPVGAEREEHRAQLREVVGLQQATHI